MKYFSELTEEEQVSAISKAAKADDIPLFQNIINESMRLLLSTDKAFMFDTDLKPVSVHSLAIKK